MSACGRRCTRSAAFALALVLAVLESRDADPTSVRLSFQSPTFTWTTGTAWQETGTASDSDFNGDGAVGFQDFLMFAQGYGSHAGGEGYDSRLDLDDDGAIGFADFTVFAQHFGQQGVVWRMPVTFRNLTSESLSVCVGDSSESVLLDVILPAGDTHVADFVLPATIAAPFSRLDPLGRVEVSLWAEVKGAPETRSVKVIPVVKPTDLPPHPRLLLSWEGIEALRNRTAQQEWARDRWEQVKRRADDALRKAVVLPPRGGNWWHWYASPTTGASLKWGEQIGEWQWAHIDPVSGEVFYGDPSDPSRDYDGCVIAFLHSGWAQSIRDLGLAYQVTGEVGYAQKAREILLAYADRYLQYPLHNTRGEAKIGGGRVHPQTLDEAVWAIPVCQGADLVWDTLDDADRKAVAEQLLQPVAREVILPHEMGVHNIQCWKNSAVGLIGLLLGDAELVWEAVEHPDRGYRRQMAGGVTPDGAWWEGTWGYHFYTLSALWGLTEGARNCGLNLYGDALKRMFDAPLMFAMPNLRLPAFNDSEEVDLVGQAAIYELAYARYGDPGYLVLLAASSRRNDYALWFGVDTPPSPAARAWASANYPNTGYAVLAQGQGEDATWLCLKYGPHGGVHGHYDKLGFVLAARGEAVGTDPGTAQYGLPIQKGWYRTTLAHNTLVVDETSQEQAEGRCVAFGYADGVDYAVADAGAIYEGVTFRRTVAMVNPNLVVFVDQVRADRERTLDLAYHPHGVWADRPAGLAWTPPDRDGYRYLEDTTIQQTADAVTLSAQASGAEPVWVMLVGGDTTDVVTGTGVGQHIEDRVPAVVFRRRARETAFGWCVSLAGEAVALRWLPVTDASGRAVSSSIAAAVAATPAGGKTHVLVANPEARQIRVVLPEGSVLETKDVFCTR